MSVAIVEELWFGDVSDEPAEQAAARSMAAMAAEVYGLRPFPVAARQLLNLVQDPNFRIATVVTTIESDPSLAARVLRTVNSAAYFLPVRVASVQRAVALLGARMVGEIATAMTVLQMFSEGPGAAAVLREHSARVGALARFLALQCGLAPDDVYTCGLLHDLGKLLMLQVRAAEYKPILQQCAGQRDTAYLVEREAYGFDHAVLAGHVLQAWGLPDHVPTAVAWHHQPARAYAEGGIVGRLVSLVRLANRISYELAGRTEPDEAILKTLSDDEAAHYLHLSSADMALMWDDLQLIVMEGEDRPVPVKLAHRRRFTAPGEEHDGAEDQTPEQAPCAVCGSPAEDQRRHCLRCNKPLCDIHAPGPGMRCRDCEAEFTQLQTVSSGTGQLAGPLALAAIGALLLVMIVAVAVPILRWFAVAVAIALLPILVAPLVLRLRQRRMRDAFLAERPEGALAERPAAAPASETEPQEDPQHEPQEDPQHEPQGDPQETGVNPSELLQ